MTPVLATVCNPPQPVLTVRLLFYTTIKAPAFSNVRYIITSMKPTMSVLNAKRITNTTITENAMMSVRNGQSQTRLI